MNIGLPLPHLESEGLEDGNSQHHEGTTDDTDIYGFFVTFIHTVGKGNKILQNHQTIRHISAILSHILFFSQVLFLWVTQILEPVEIGTELFKHTLAHLFPFVVF